MRISSSPPCQNDPPSVFAVPLDVLKERLEGLYRRYDDRRLVSPDPLQYLYRYRRVADREVAGLVASCLAYGRVDTICASVEKVLTIMGVSPARFAASASGTQLRRSLSGFRHRMTSGDDVAGLISAAGALLREFGSLNNCFLRGLSRRDETVEGAICEFSAMLAGRRGCPECFLVPSPSGGSACKRLNLYLRWMVRRDRVDPGGWKGVSPAKLIVPLDTHMFRIGCLLGLTGRAQADMKAALEITAGFRRIAPEDPVRYDFALAHTGMRGDGSLQELIKDY